MSVEKERRFYAVEKRSDGFHYLELTELGKDSDGNGYERGWVKVLVPLFTSVVITENFFYHEDSNKVLKEALKMCIYKFMHELKDRLHTALSKGTKPLS